MIRLREKIGYGFGDMASSDTRMHVAVSTVDKLVDYCMNTPEDGLSTTASVETLKRLIDKNMTVMKNL